MSEREKVLKIAFAAGAITDALAILPMLLPSLAGLVWGFEDVSGAYRFAMGYAASLMLGWTGLLAWAYCRPLERSFVAVLTVGVICGLVGAEVMAAASGTFAPWRMIPTWMLQAALLTLFVFGFHHDELRRWASPRERLTTEPASTRPDPRK